MIFRKEGSLLLKKSQTGILYHMQPQSPVRSRNVGVVAKVWKRLLRISLSKALKEKKEES